MKRSLSLLRAAGWLLVIIVTIGLVLPKDYRISREIFIKASRTHIHLYVNDLRLWRKWVPWQQQDNVRIRIDSPRGIGAQLHWKSPDSYGELTIMDASVVDGIRYDMVLDGRDTASGRIRYQPMGQGTLVRWSMEGRVSLPLVGGYMALLMDSLTGPFFEQGLQQLKQLAEQQTR